MKRPSPWLISLLLLLPWLWTAVALNYLVATLAAYAYVVATGVIAWKAPKRAWIWVVATWLPILGWFALLQPSNDRVWEPEVAQEVSAVFDGDRVTVSNVRNFTYHSETEFDESWEERTYDLSKLDTVDLVMCYWDGNTAIAHTMLSFGFGGEEYVCVSVETRRELGEAWGGLPGFYKQFEIIYLMADERDLINQRTSHRGEEVYLYPLKIPKADIRKYLVHVLEHCTTLSTDPEFYDTFEHNCTSGLTLMGKQLWPERKRPTGVKALLNGYTDEYNYTAGRISNELPFEELKRRSYITKRGHELRDDPDFSKKIRADLP